MPDFLVPIGITFLTSDMPTAIIAALAVCMLLYLPRKKMTITHFVELFFAGYADIFPALAAIACCFGSFF